MSDHRPLSTKDEADLRRFRALADLLDNAFQVPGTNWRFGIDPLLVLLPGVGDVLGAAFAAWGWLLARRLGAPPAVQRKMLGNIAIDMLGGAVLVVGDLFDATFKAHIRNRRLLDDWLHHRTIVETVAPQGSRGAGARIAGRQPTSRKVWVLLAIAIVGLAAMGLTIWLAVSALRWLFGA